MLTRPQRRVVGATAVIVAVALGALGGQALADRTDDPYAPLDRFARVYSDIEQHYVDEVDPDALVDAAIEGMVDSLDPHSRWLDEEERRALEEENEGRYEGIGIEARPVPAGALVIRVLPQGPAAVAGLRPRDRIVAVEGESVRGKPLDAISSKLKGPRGTRVTLTIERDGVEGTVELAPVRDRIDLPNVVAGRLPGDIAYVRLVGFHVDAAKDVQRAVREQRNDGATAGVLLDLRDNPGGLLDEAVALVDLFVDDGPIVSTRGRLEGDRVLTATRGGFGTELPVVVLVNGGSASASEVVVGALQDLERATIVGTSTYGKGTVQTVFGRDGGGLKLTIARYYTPAGTPVAPNTGRTPDILVDHPTERGPRQALLDALAEQPEAVREDLLPLAQALPDDEEVDPILDWDAPLSERLASDPQLRAALDVFSQ